MHKRMKHIEVDYHNTKHAVNRGHVTLGYLNTDDNLADMMTKCFTRVRHKLLAGRVLELQVGDAFVDFHGNPIKHVELEPRSDKLYQEMPPGLKIDMLLPDRRGSAEAVQLVRVLEACAELASEGGKTAELAKEISQGALAMLIEMVIGHLSAHVHQRIHAAVASRAQNST